MATTDEQYASGGLVPTIEIGQLEPGSIVGMEDEQYRYNLTVIRVGQQVVAQAWRLDKHQPTGDDGQPAWVRQRGEVALPGSCLDVNDYRGQTSFEAPAVHLVPVDVVPDILAVHLRAYLRQPSTETGQYPSYITGPITALWVIHRRASKRVR